MYTVTMKRPKVLRGINPTLIKIDKEYLWSKYELYELHGELYISMSGYTMKKTWTHIHSYLDLGAYDIINLMYHCDDMPPKHLVDLILTLYNMKRLDIHKNTFFKDLV